MMQSRHSFSVGGNKGASMFNACSIIFTDYHSFVRIVNSLQTDENSTSFDTHSNKIHKLVRVVTQNKNEFIDEHPILIDKLNENYDMNSDDFTISDFPKMIGNCYAIYINFNDNKISCNTGFFMSKSFKKRYIRYLLHEFDADIVDKFIANVM